MRLKRVEAIRFGRLDSMALGDLGAGLNVVFGPNEAGKTSFTDLVRHLLYGFPGKRGGQAVYESQVGKRQGRLVFFDDTGEWVVDRVEGPRGGQVKVSEVCGPERPDLIERITAGVSNNAFRVVFGFGLAELAEIESDRASGDDVLSRLYAAQAGLQISPSDVRADLEKSTAHLWAQRGVSKPVLNDLKSRIERVRREIGGLERAAATYAEDQERLAELSQRLLEARDQRAGASLRFRELTAAAERLESLERLRDEIQSEVDTATSGLATAGERLERLSVDERVLAVACELTAVLDDLSGFRQRLDTVHGHDLEVLVLRGRAETALLEAAVTPEQAVAVDIGPETIKGIERWRDRLAALMSQSDASLRDARRERAAADAMAGRDPALSLAAPAPAQRLPAFVMLGAGLLLAAGAAFMREWVSVVFGAVIAFVGGVLLLRSGRMAVPAAAGPSAEDLEQRACTAEELARIDSDELEAARTEWRSWLAARGLSVAGDDAAAVAIMVAAVKDWRLAARELDRRQEAQATDFAWCEAYRSRLAAAVGAFLPGVDDAPLEEIPTLAARARELLDFTLAASAQRDEIARESERLGELVANAERRQAVARDDTTATLERIGMSDCDALQVRADAEAAGCAAREADDAYDELLGEHTTLTTHLNSAGRDSAMAELRLELTGLVERTEAALERYAVLALATRLMARTQEYHERTRQPEVIRRASEVFALITGGRYVRVSVPRSGEFLVYDEVARIKPSSELSTGTVQQLYLALRIALIETLDGVGPGLPVLMDDILVNFDPQRREGAARAVADLAARRQVVVFTCHPQTAALFEQVVPGRTLLTLDRC